MALTAGTPAPDFELPWKPGGDLVRLSDHRGQKVVLLFFPLAFSSVCTDEMCEVATNYTRYEDLNARVLGISIDSPYANRKFAAECGATFPILSDFNRTVIADYDVVWEDLHGLLNVAERSAFVIDTKGVVSWSWVAEHPGVMPDFDAILDAVEAAE